MGTSMSVASLALRHGVAAAQARQFDKARPLLEQATSESPDDAVAWFWLAIAAPSADAAIPCLRRVLAIDPAHGRAREVLSMLLVGEARRLASTGTHGQARELATEAAELDPGSEAVWLTLATVTDDQSERITALRHASALAPDNSLIRTRLRQALLSRGVMIAQTDRAEARARFREAAELDPTDPRVWQALANLADSRAEWLQALRDLLLVCPDHPRGRQTLRNALVDDAQALAAADCVDESCERWREALALTGGDIEAWLGLAAVTPDQEEATRAIEAAYEMDPADPRAAAAMDRLRAPQIDPAAIEPPLDAFARFGTAAEDAERADPADAPLDSLLDAFVEATAPAPPVQVQPAVAARMAPPAPPPVAPEIDRVEARVDPASPAHVDAPEPREERPIAPAAADTRAEPAAMSPASLTLASPPAAAVAERKVNGATRHTVMIVDDSPTIRKILGLSLERAGYDVIAEPHGEAAIERLRSGVPDLILLDIAMPGMDGYEVCRKIKQDPRTADVPVVMLSGKGAFFDKVKGHMAGATEYLTKPFETPAVLAVVSSHCQKPAEVAHG